MTMRAALLTDSHAAPLRMKFPVVSSMIPIILVAGLVHLVSEMVVNLVELVVYQLLFQFVVEIPFFSYAALMM